MIEPVVRESTGTDPVLFRAGTTSLWSGPEHFLSMSRTMRSILPDI